MEEIESLLKLKLEDIKAQISQVRESQVGLEGTKLAQSLEAKERELEARKFRLNIALELLEGTIFALYTMEDGSLILVKPSEQSSQLIKRAEELGARVANVEILGKEEGSQS